MWAWIDEEAGVLRERVFAEPFGIPEDEATGAAAIALTARLGRPLDIRQGRGSRILTRPWTTGWWRSRGGWSWTRCASTDSRRDRRAAPSPAAAASMAAGCGGSWWESASAPRCGA